MQVDKQYFIHIGREIASTHPYPTGINSDFEALWLGESFPFLEMGKIHLFAKAYDSGSIRIALFQSEEDSDWQFCLYARSKQLASECIEDFISSVESSSTFKEHTKLWGPILFSTWNAYRFIKHKYQLDYFPGEEPVPTDYYDDFIKLGFSDWQLYESRLIKNQNWKYWFSGLRYKLPKGNPLEVIYVKGEEVNPYLEKIYTISLDIFANNWGYSSMPSENFIQQYQQPKDSQVVLGLAMIEQQIIGFCFSYPIGGWNRLKGNTAVIKTIGIGSDHTGKGYGFQLALDMHRYWIEKGCKHMIHAYMKDDNKSLSLSNLYSKRIRQYALVKKEY